ncbi:zinc-binding dehydrogenase [Pendulispora rubella]|uniref:Zinc-binding dehydrogenase n=1 Tax=Pendulispora rubella TaxID=2741070 RepID=A0ABZ2KXM0_9BACT
MSHRSTEAWVLRRGDGGKTFGPLRRETIDLPPMQPDDVLVRPLYGCWEGNMDHALRRSPVDICALREEDAVVLGNSGVVEVTDVGANVEGLAPGDVGIVFCNGTWDEYGYPIRILGYDAPGTMGVLAKTIKLHHKQIVPIPKPTRFSLPQWAAFSLRYVTAWANWRVALACWRSQMDACPPEDALVFAWGGGVALAELSLAKMMGFRTAMVTSQPSRAALLKEMGIDPIDRSTWTDATFEGEFLKAVRERSGGRGVSIFVDNLGIHYKTALKSLARQGTIATSGWKHGLTFASVRAMECIGRHLHVHTHYARYDEGEAAVRFAEEHGWMAPADERIYGWDEIPLLAEEYASGRIETYFPIFRVNE